MAQFASYCRRNRIAPEPSKTQLLPVGDAAQVRQLRAHVAWELGGHIGMHTPDGDSPRTLVDAECHAPA